MTSRIALAFLLVACGSKTALEVAPERPGDTSTDDDADASVDASRRDARVERDASPRDARADALRRDAPSDGPVDAVIVDAPVDADLCTPFRERVPTVTLELRLLVDRSFSMANETATGRTKSEELADGFARFFALPEAAGTFVSLTFFPGAPIACSRDSDCAVGRCLMPDICSDESSLCTDDSMCGGLRCVRFGRCDVNRLNIVTCLVPERPDAGTVCPGEVDCIDFGYCENGPPWRPFRDVPICSPSFYLSPSVGAVRLPAGAEALDETLGAIVPAGGTPTVPALEGMHQAAELRASWTHRKVLIVLATDTRSTGCPGRGGLVALRAAAADGLANGVPTFVLAILGVDEGDEAADLESVAEAGGTELALFSTAESVADALVDYLRQLRAEESACAFELPTGARAGLEAFLVESGTSTPIPRVADANACVAGRGFHFSHDVDDGEPVGHVELCEASCSAVTRGARLEIQNRCE